MQIALNELIPEINQSWTGQTPAHVEQIQLLDEIEREQTALLYNTVEYRPSVYIFNDPTIQKRITKLQANI